MIEMARHCAFCVSPRRQEIEEKILREEILQKEAAEILGVSPGTVCLHLQRHLKPKIREVAQPHLEKFAWWIMDTAETIKKEADKAVKDIDHFHDGSREHKVCSSEAREWTKLLIALYLKIGGLFVQEQE